MAYGSGDKENHIYDWANGMFYYRAFSEADRTLIVDRDMSKLGTVHVWFLNDEEIDYYSSHSLREYEDTRYCRFRRYYKPDSFGYLEHETIAERLERWNGYADTEGTGKGYRPSIYINTDSIQFSAGQ